MLVFFRLRLMSPKKKVAQDDGSVTVLNVFADTLLVVLRIQMFALYMFDIRIRTSAFYPWPKFSLRRTVL